jgi:dihydrolipoamide dehydrogenase
MHIAIIGGGPAGYVGAIRAAQLGAEVTLIERGGLGGTCLHRGCIPTKTLLHSAAAFRACAESEAFGIVAQGVGIDMAAVMRRKDGVVASLGEGIARLVKANGIRAIKGDARFIARDRLGVREGGQETEVAADSILIATGSSPAVPPIAGVGMPGVIDSDAALMLEHVPQRLCVIGGGVIGMEFACIFRNFGAEVTVVEALPTVLSAIDRDIVNRLLMRLKRGGINIHAGVAVKAIDKEGEGLRVRCEHDAGPLDIFAESVLIATGRRPNVEGLNLEGVGVDLDRRGVKVNERFETSVAGVYAVGDVTGGMLLAHVASAQAVACVEGMLGVGATPPNEDAVPAVVFTSPEIATVGLNEQQAAARSIPVKTGRFALGANAMALAMGESYGLVKIVAHAESERVLGAHILGAQADALIHEAALAVSKGLTLSDLAHTVHAHPTLSEALHEAALDALGRAIHSAPKRS